MKELHSFGWYAARIAPLMPKKAFKPVPARLVEDTKGIFQTI